MHENLHEDAHVQYGHWSGTFSADEVDLRSPEMYLGIDKGKWLLVVIDIYVFGGTQSIIGYAVEQREGTHAAMMTAITEHHRLEVTRVVDRTEEPADHNDTNPPAPVVVPMTWATEVIASGFKRVHLRLLHLPIGVREEDVEIVEVASIVGNEGA